MGTYITQAKDHWGGLIDGQLPDNPTLIKLATDVVYANPSKWINTLLVESFVRNPVGTDPLDIGTVDGEGVFTPDVTRLNDMLALNIRRLGREFWRGIIKHGRNLRTSGTVTPAEVAATNKAAAAVDVFSNLGDDDNEVES